MDGLFKKKRRKRKEERGKDRWVGKRKGLVGRQEKRKGLVTVKKMD